MHQGEDLICFSHLRWGFVYQRPNHLMSRCARTRRCYFFEEPIFDAEDSAPRIAVSRAGPSLFTCVPHLRPGLAGLDVFTALRRLLDELIVAEAITPGVLWFYTPMALPFARHVSARVVVYDCMDELSGFRGAPAELRELETELFTRADLVFTGGQSLFEAKRARHRHIHAFPSSVDAQHFAAARTLAEEPEDQRPISRPRIGYFGVIDERLDLDLIAGIADARPDWQIVMIGPIVKISPDSLPRRANIHYLGSKPYAALPSYIAGWDVAIMPFARNEATRFISPTKTPEYLAAGRPVVSTAIRDVVRPYGERGLVAIANTPEQFVAAIEAQLRAPDPAKWLAKVDAFLAGNSWDATWTRMRGLIESATRSEIACTTI